MDTWKISKSLIGAQVSIVSNSFIDTVLELLNILNNVPPLSNVSLVGEN